MNEEVQSEMKAAQTRKAPASRAEGAALLMALAMLIMFSMMGMAGIRFMTIELDETKYDLDLIGTRYQAYGGLNAAIGEIQSALKQGTQPQAAYEPKMPLYTSVFTGESVILEEDPDKVNTVRVTVALVQGSLAGALEGVGLQGSALAAVQANAAATTGARYYRIESQAIQKAGFRGQDPEREETAEAPAARSVRKVTSQVVALVAFQASGDYDIVFWNEGRVHEALSAAAADEAVAAEPAEGTETPKTPETEAVAPVETTETPQGS